FYRLEQSRASGELLDCMLAIVPLTFDSPALLAAGLGLSTVAMVIARLRRVKIRLPGSAMILAAMALFSLSAGGITWRRRMTQDVLVLVDVSPSTRVADFRD